MPACSPPQCCVQHGALLFQTREEHCFEPQLKWLDEKHRLAAENRNGIPGTGTALSSSINKQHLLYFVHGGVMMVFFHSPREIPKGEMSIPIIFSMSNSLYFLFAQTSDLEGCCRGLALQPDHALLLPPFASSSVPSYNCLSVYLSPWLLVQSLKEPLPGLSPSASPWLPCLSPRFVVVSHLGSQIQVRVSSPQANGYGPRGLGAGQQKNPNLPKGHNGTLWRNSLKRGSKGEGCTYVAAESRRTS